jgi:pyridoxal phosphate enzyme (YggS family)
MSESITSRYKRIVEEVNTLAMQRDRQRGNIRIIVVSKRQNIEGCLEVIAAGATNLGENYAEETVEKFSHINIGKLNIHLIGHLQSRKIRLLYPIFSTIQTLDSLEISEKVNHFYDEKKSNIKALIELNLTNELNKSGFMVKNKNEMEIFFQSFKKIIQMPNMQVIGLMTMGYFPENGETNRFIFRRTREILEELKEKFRLERFDELSMGTSGDYQTAIQEGATMVRIGEKIMGSRENLVKKW